jgi:hypothetical protein
MGRKRTFEKSDFWTPSPGPLSVHNREAECRRKLENAKVICREAYAGASGNLSIPPLLWLEGMLFVPINVGRLSNISTCWILVLTLFFS